jgi:predicted CoA-binding protein
MPSPSVDRYVVVRYLERDGYVTMPISPRELVVVATALAAMVCDSRRAN